MESEAESDLSADTSITIPYSNDASALLDGDSPSPCSMEATSNMPVLLQAVDIAAASFAGGRDGLLRQRKRLEAFYENGDAPQSAFLAGTSKSDCVALSTESVLPSNGNGREDDSAVPKSESDGHPTSGETVAVQCCTKAELKIAGTSKERAKRVVYGPRTKVPKRLFGRRRRKPKDKNLEECDLAEVGEKYSRNENIRRYWLESKSMWPYRGAAKPARVQKVPVDFLEKPDEADHLFTCSEEDFELSENDDGNDYFEFYIGQRLLRVSLKDAMWFSARSVSLRFTFLRSADFWPPAPLGSPALRCRRLIIEGIEWDRFCAIVNEIRKVEKEFGEPLWYVEDEMLRNMKLVDGSGLLGEICVGAALCDPPSGSHGPIELVYGLAHDHFYVDELFSRLLDIEASRRSGRWQNYFKWKKSMKQEECPFLTLPDSVISRILRFLASEDRTVMGGLCRRLRKLVIAGTRSREALSSCGSALSVHGSNSPLRLSPDASA